MVTTLATLYVLECPFILGSSLPWAGKCSVASQFTLSVIDFHEIPSLTFYISFFYWTFSMIRKIMDFQAIFFLTNHNLPHHNKQIFLFWKQSSRWAHVVFINVFTPNYEPMKIEHIFMNHIWEVWTCEKKTVKMKRSNCKDLEYSCCKYYNISYFKHRHIWSDKMWQPYRWHHNNLLQGQREIPTQKGYIGMFVVFQFIQ